MLGAAVRLQFLASSDVSTSSIDLAVWTNKVRQEKYARRLDTVLIGVGQDGEIIVIVLAKRIVPKNFSESDTLPKET